MLTFLNQSKPAFTIPDQGGDESPLRTLDLVRAPRLPHQRVVDGLREQIESGELVPGDQVPSLSRLCETYDVSRVTALKAIAVLRDEGLIETVPRWGNFVK